MKINTLKTVCCNVFLLTFFTLSPIHAAQQPPSPQQQQTQPAASAPSPLEDALKKGKYSKNTTLFYSKNNFLPVWFENGTPTTAQKVALDVLTHTDLEGLDPKDYQQSAASSWIESELKLTETFLKFIEDVRVGRIPAKSVARTIKIVSPQTNAVDLLMDALKSGGSFERLRTMAPPLPDYIKIKKLLALYLDMEKNIADWPQITAKSPLKIGTEDKAIPMARQLLIFLGDLDSTKIDDKTIHSEKFDPQLEEAVRRFQARHTLEVDGVIGGKTKEAMNWPLRAQINKMIANMERLRWLPDDMGERYIQVNVGGYEVTAVEGDQIKIRMPAIVGKTATRTPLFYAPLKNIIINPSWGVPAGIMQRDKLPKIRRDPDYVRRAGFTIYDHSGHVVDPDQADWEGSGSEYHLRQGPGRHNALGRIKLNIENPYTIYMHGTPEEKLFNKAARAFSSGCIRLKFPVDMAAWALSHTTQWDKEKIEAGIKSGRTQSIKLDKVIPVYFTYMTSWIDEENNVHFSDDPYKMDDALIKILKLSENPPRPDKKS